METHWNPVWKTKRAQQDDSTDKKMLTLSKSEDLSSIPSTHIKENNSWKLSSEDHIVTPHSSHPQPSINTETNKCRHFCLKKKKDQKSEQEELSKRWKTGYLEWCKKGSQSQGMQKAKKASLLQVSRRIQVCQPLTLAMWESLSGSIFEHIISNHGLVKSLTQLLPSTNVSSWPGDGGAEL